MMASRNHSPSSASGASPPTNVQVDAQEYAPYPSTSYPHYSSPRSVPSTSPPHPPISSPVIATSDVDATAAAMMADLSVLNPFERWIVSANKPQFNAISGAVGGFTSGIITCPLDVIKTRLQAGGGYAPVSKGRHVGHEKVYRGLVGTFQTIWRTEGIRGLYRGLGPIVMGYLPTWGVWFTVYDLCKIRMREYNSKPFFFCPTRFFLLPPFEPLGFLLSRSVVYSFPVTAITETSG